MNDFINCGYGGWGGGEKGVWESSLLYTGIEQVLEVFFFFNSTWNRVGIHRVVVPARQATQPGGMGSLDSIPGLLKSLKIRTQFSGFNQVTFSEFKNMVIKIYYTVRHHSHGNLKKTRAI
jgi:hypothetical protein